MRIKIRAWFCILLAACTLMGLALAESSQTEPLIFYVTDTDPNVINDNVYNFKDRLQAEGFYSDNVGSDVLTSCLMDVQTMAAVRKVTEYNPDLTYYDEGVSYTLYWRVMGENNDGQALISPNSGTLQMGYQGKAVTELQYALTGLGYGQAGMTSGVYDEALQKAVDDFVLCNNISYDSASGIPIHLRLAILDDEAVAYSESAVQGNIIERMRSYFGGTSRLLGFSMPVWVMWIAGFILVCAIAFLLLRFLGDKTAHQENVAPQCNSVDATHPGRGEVIFRIEYNGMRVFHRVRMSNVILIGRSVGSFPLNPADLTVSRKQCELIPDKGKLRLRNLSSHGTTLNGEKLKGMGDTRVDDRFVHNGDQIRFGAHIVTVYYKEPS